MVDADDCTINNGNITIRTGRGFNKTHQRLTRDTGHNDADRIINFNIRFDDEHYYDGDNP
jgi:hypothetical protein